MKSPILKDYYTLADAARIIGMNRDSLRMWCKRGKLPYTINPLNNRWMIPAVEIEKLKKKLETYDDQVR